jgi:hypothetical protein
MDLRFLRQLLTKLVISKIFLDILIKIVYNLITSFYFNEGEINKAYYESVFKMIF